MPALLPPSHVALPSDVLSDHARQALGQSGQPLSSAYRRAAHALGMECVGVNILSVQGLLPEGLHALISRHNPDLAKAMGKTGGVRFVYTHPSADAVEVLKSTDRLALGWLVKQGILGAQPGNSVIDTGQGGLTRTMPGFPDHSQISMDSDVKRAMDTPTLPFSDRLDPVLFRWLSLFHEAGHAQRAMDPAPFQLSVPNFPAQVAINQLLRGPTSHSEDMGGVFDESYADVFAVLSLLKLTHASPEAWAVIDFLHQSRHADQHNSTTKGFDPHSDTGALDRLLSEVKDNPNRLAQLNEAPTGEIRKWASRYASWGASRWARSKSVADPALGWTQVIPNETETLENQALLSSAFFGIQEDKMADYLRSRIAAYATAKGHKEALRSPVTDGDPLLIFLATQDDRFLHAFENSGTPHTHEVAVKILDAPPFGQLGQKEIDRAFNELDEVAKVKIKMRAATGIFFDDPKNLMRESDYQASRGKLAMEALRQNLPETDLWSTTSTTLASNRRMRR